MRRLLAILLFALSAHVMAAPTVQDVQRAVASGNYARADSLLQQVIAAHPNSARAHFIYAQVLERENRADAGLAQLEQARNLDPSLSFDSEARFAAVERRLRSKASATAPRSAMSPSAAQLAAPSAAPLTAPVAAAATALPAVHRGPSASAWIALLVAVIVIGAVLSWTVRRARAKREDGERDYGRAALKRATELLDAVRAAKLDIRLSTVAGHEALVREADDLETELRNIVDALYAAQTDPRATPRPGLGYDGPPEARLDSLALQLESLKARAAGRADPAAAQNAPSAYALEAERFGRAASQSPYGAPPQPWQSGQPQPGQFGQPPVVVQAPPAGGGMGMGGGLLTGVLLGEVLGRVGGGRERDVIIDERNPRENVDFGRGDNWDNSADSGAIDTGNDGGVDFGQGGDDWGDSGSDNSTDI